jgi:hypothetical protein
VQKSAVRRLAQSGDEGLTKVDRPTATPPVLRQLFASAKKDQLENAAMVWVGPDGAVAMVVFTSIRSHRPSFSQASVRE